MGAVFGPTRFSLVRISVRDLAADGKSLLRNSGVGGGGQNVILISTPATRNSFICVNGRGRFEGQTAGGHPKPFLGLGHLSCSAGIERARKCLQGEHLSDAVAVPTVWWG